MLGDIGINVLSDLLALILGVAIYWIFFLISKRYQLLKFFGIIKSRKVSIYTSNVRVQEYGSKGLGGILYSYQGQTIPYEELKAAIQLQGMFNYFLPSLFEKPKLLSKLLVSDIDANVSVSPREENIIDTSSTIISMGFPAYNSVSNFIQKSFSLYAMSGYIQSQVSSRTDKYQQTIRPEPYLPPSGISAGTATPHIGNSISTFSTESELVSSSASGSTIDLPTIISGSAGKADITITKKPIIRIEGGSQYTETSIGFVQRVLDNKNKRSVFYIAGLSENSTAGSAYFLAKNWKKLFDRYGSDIPFLILLKIENNNNQLADIIFEK